MAQSDQDKLIGLVEDASAKAGKARTAHGMMALRAREMSPSVRAELAEADKAIREQQGILASIRQLVGKRAGRKKDE